MELFDAFEKTDWLWLYKDGVMSRYDADDREFFEILDAWKELCAKSRMMAPLAAGVTDAELDELTDRGCWLEFEFTWPQTADGMTFDRLLIELIPSARGFNLIRGYEGDCTGRCFSVNIEEGDMSGVYELVKNL